VLAIVTIPPFILAYRELVSFGRALEFAGAVGGVILAIVPLLMLRAARKTGDIVPEWQCNKLITSLPVKTIIVLLYTFTAFYAITELLYNTNVLTEGMDNLLIQMNVFVPKVDG